MRNDKDNYSKRTAATVKAILVRQGLDAKVWNMGDGRMFQVELPNSIYNRAKVKTAGFILLPADSNFVTFKTF